MEYCAKFVWCLHICLVFLFLTLRIKYRMGNINFFTRNIFFLKTNFGCSKVQAKYLILTSGIPLPVNVARLLINNPAKHYLFKVTHRNARNRCEICSTLTIQTPMTSIWHFLLITLNISHTFF